LRKFAPTLRSAYMPLSIPNGPQIAFGKIAGSRVGLALQDAPSAAPHSTFSRPLHALLADPHARPFCALSGRPRQSFFQALPDASKPARYATVGVWFESVAQLVEHRPFKALVLGSSPSALTIHPIPSRRNTPVAAGERFAHRLYRLRKYPVLLKGTGLPVP
jgi:hypothetical protein